MPNAAHRAWTFGHAAHSPGDEVALFSVIKWSVFVGKNSRPRPNGSLTASSAAFTISPPPLLIEDTRLFLCVFTQQEALRRDILEFLLKSGQLILEI